MIKKIIGNKIISLLSVASTNEHARNLVQEGSPEEGTVIIAGEQKKGRGHGKNTWHSKRGKNLLFSIILYPRFILANTQFLLSKTISLGIYDYLCRYVSDVAIKWPNDIYVDDRKIAGILIENDLTGSSLNRSIVGIGININQVKFPEDLPNPVSMTQMIEKELYLKEGLNKLCALLDKRYQML